MRCPKCGEDKLSDEFSAVRTLGRAPATGHDYDLACCCLRCLDKTLPAETMVQQGIALELQRLDGTHKQQLRAAALQQRRGSTMVVSLVMMNGEQLLVPVGQDSTVKDLKIFLGGAHDRDPKQFRLLLGLQEMKVRSEIGTANLVSRYTGVDTIDGAVIRAILPFSQYAGKQVIPGAKTDASGNAVGTDGDLIGVGTLQGLTVAVINLCPQHCKFEKAEGALREMGFAVEILDGMPVQARLDAMLEHASQLWLVSGTEVDGGPMPPGALASISAFFQRGNGVYIWGDNQPWYYHANIVAKELLGRGVALSGCDPGQKVLQAAAAPNKPGFDTSSHIFTGIVNLYEGFTVARIKLNGASRALKPIMVSSDGHPVTAVFEDGQRRAIIDGAFTRLYSNWDEAGTSRFVKNAAGWLCAIDIDWVN